MGFGGSAGEEGERRAQGVAVGMPHFAQRCRELLASVVCEGLGAELGAVSKCV